MRSDADFSDNDRTIKVYRLKVPFSESQATWEQASNGEPWDSPGASGTADRESTDIGSILIDEDEPLDIEKQISLSTTQIQQMVSGAFVNNGFIIIADNEEDDRFSYRTSDASAATKRPKLVIHYTTSSATNTPTSTPTPGPSPTPTRTPTPGASPTPTATQPPQGAFNNATFVYDGDGKRVKSTFNGATTTYFVGNHYEVTGSTIIKYYYAGSQRIAMRTNGTLNFLLGDHLGSTSLTTNSSGQVVSQLKYKAWGEERYASGPTSTNYTYTGQYSYTNDFGLMFYNARWYDPYITQFSQPDSIIPDPYNPLDWNRYSYARNNPLRYTDPSGHMPCYSCVLPHLLLEYMGAFFGWSPDYRGVSIAEALVTNGDTITAAGIAVQSEWYIEAWDDPSNPASSSYGPAQITQAEIDEYGLSGQDLHDPTISVQVMTSRINKVVSACPNCIDRDQVILAALAQNGSEYALNALKDASLRDRLPDGGLDWEPYFDSLNPKGNLYDLRANGHHNYDSRFMLHLFMNDLEELKKRGWDLPELTPDDWDYINRLRWDNR